MSFPSSNAPGLQVPEEVVRRKTAITPGNIPVFDIDGKIIDSGGKLIGPGYLSPKLTRFYQKLYSNPGSIKIGFIGDSTSDFASNASQIPVFTQVAYGQAGDPLGALNYTAVGGFPTCLPNFGSGGQTLAAWIGNPTGSNGLNAVIAAGLDLGIVAHGINDARTNSVTKDQLKALIIQQMNSLIAGSPGTDWILRMPNSFKIPATNTYIQQGTYPSLAAAAKAQTDILYYAYKELENYWPNVLLFNSQDLIFGRVCRATTSLMSDDIHPNYDLIVKELVNIIAPPLPFSKGLSVDAINVNFPAPYTIYPRAMENTDFYDLIASARYNAQGANYIDVTCDNASILSGLLRRGDIINFGDTFFINTNITVFTALTVQDATHLRIIFTGSVPANTITGGPVKFFRSKYYNDINTMPYIDNRVVYKYIRTANISGGNGYIDISTSDQSLIYGYNGRYGSTIVPASKWQLLTTNVFIVAGLAPIVLTGASFITLNETTLRINIAGSYGAYAGNAIIAGTQNFEDPFSIKTACALLYGNPAFTSSDVYGRMGVSGSGLYYNGGNGKASVPGVIYLDSSDPAGNTITNTIAKTYFASLFSFIANTINPGEGIDIECSFVLSTAATPGNIIFTIELGGNTIALTIPSTALPASANGALVKLNASLFAKGYTAGYTAVGGNALLSGGVSANVIRTTDIPALSGTGVNLTIANNLRISTQFSVADVGNIIVMKTMKVITHNS